MSGSALSDIKHELQVLYLIKHELQVCLFTKEFSIYMLLSRENQGKSFVKMCFITYIDSSHGYDFLRVINEV